MCAHYAVCRSSNAIYTKRIDLHSFFATLEIIFGEFALMKSSIAIYFGSTTAAVVSALNVDQ